MQQFIFTVLRKLAFGVGLVVVSWCVNHGIFTQVQLDKWLYTLAGILAMIVAAAWTEYILPWAKSKLQKPSTTTVQSVNPPAK